MRPRPPRGARRAGSSKQRWTAAAGRLSKLTASRSSQSSGEAHPRAVASDRAEPLAPARPHREYALLSGTVRFLLARLSAPLDTHAMLSDGLGRGPGDAGLAD